MSKLYDTVDYNNLKFEYIDPTKDVSFYEYMDSKELFNKIRDNRIKFDEVLKRQNEFLNKLNNTRIGKKTDKKKEVINNLVINFFKVYSKMVLDVAYKANQNKTEGTGRKMLTPKQMIQRLPIALAQAKAGNNSESLLNEKRQIVYYLHRSKQISKKVYNNIIKSI